MPPKTGAAAGPSADEVARGVQVCSFIDGARRGDPGTLLDPAGATLWRYEIDAKWPRVFPLTLCPWFFKADFIVSNPARQEVVRIHRLGGILPRFIMIRDGRTVGKITYRNVLRTRSALEFVAGPTWNFRQRLFHLYFYGDSEAGQRLWIVVGPSKKQWNMLLPPGTEDVYLPAALAFLHLEYWRH